MGWEFLAWIVFVGGLWGFGVMCADVTRIATLIWRKIRQGRN